MSTEAQNRAFNTQKRMTQINGASTQMIYDANGNTKRDEDDKN